MLSVQNYQSINQVEQLHIMETVAMDGFAFSGFLQIKVKRDFNYTLQSTGSIEVWSERDLEWHVVSTILANEIQDVWDVAEELRIRALVILGGEDPR